MHFDELKNVMLIAVEGRKRMVPIVVTITYPSKYLLPQIFAVVNSPAPRLNFGTNLFRVSNGPRTGRFALFAPKKCSKLRTCGVESNLASSLETYQEIWEDPDVGCGSDFDEEEEEEELEENDLDDEGDWGEAKYAPANTNTVNMSTTNKYEEDLVKGITFCCFFLLIFSYIVFIS